MTSMKTPELQRDLLKGGIFLTGAPRSGTSILGKIIATLKDIEYHFEPPTLYMICSSYADKFIDKTSARVLLQNYLCEDLLLESIQGRGVNLRPSDDSQILNSIDWPELNQRWINIPNRAEAIRYGLENNIRLALKSPNTFDALSLVRDVIKDPSIIIIKRNGFDVLRSIIAKQWLSDKSLKTELWPYRDVEKKINIPYWVPNRFSEDWEEMSCITRSALMWAVHADIGLTSSNEKDTIIVSYEELTESPTTTTEVLTQFIGTEATHHTSKIINTIRCREKRSNNDDIEKILSKESQEIYEYFVQTNKAWGY